MTEKTEIDTTKMGVENEEASAEKHTEEKAMENAQHSKETEQEKGKDEGEENSAPPTCMSRICQFYSNNEFICQIIVVILLARAYPPLGAEYLQPQITSTWIAVIFIFILAGLGLKTEELSKAFQRLKFNLFVQVFNFGVVSSIVFGVSRGLAGVGIVSQALADGMVVCASLPLTINMCLVLTKSAGGDEASAIFNSAFGNMLGVFLSPILILTYLGVTGEVDLFGVFYKLALRVVVPVTFGQLLQKFCPPVVAFNKKYKPYFKKAQQYALVFIVYTVFCRTFIDDTESNVGDIFIMIIVQFIQLCLVMTIAWFALKIFFPNEPKLRVMGLYGCTHKTVAMGVPLINAIYESNPLVGLYTLPLLIWHPMQLVLGSYIAPKLYDWVQDEKKRLGIDQEDEEDGDDVEAPEDNTAEPNNDAENAIVATDSKGSKEFEC